MSKAMVKYLPWIAAMNRKAKEVRELAELIEAEVEMPTGGSRAYLLEYSLEIQRAAEVIRAFGDRIAFHTRDV